MQEWRERSCYTSSVSSIGISIVSRSRPVSRWLIEYVYFSLPAYPTDGMWRQLSRQLWLFVVGLIATMCIGAWDVF